MSAMKPGLAALSGAAIFVLSACNGASKPTPVSDGAPWQFSAASHRIRAASCPQGAVDSFAMSFLVEATPVSLGDAEAVDEALDGLTFRGGWALDTDFASFGGLSGLKVLPDGNLLAVSDAGALVQIAFDQQAMQPGRQATLTYLTDEAGEILTGKEKADSEGLDVRGGVAFVSFERDHRVAAYDFSTCGGQAHAVPVAHMGSQPPGLSVHVGDNAGAEALSLDGETLHVGLESTDSGLAPVGEVRADGTIAFLRRLWIDAGRVPLVGMDASDGETFTVHRAYNPILKRNTIHIRMQNGKGDHLLARMAGGLTLDNFEGISAWPLPDGRTRLFLISDDNFSDSQRTLLYVFETDSDL